MTPVRKARRISQQTWTYMALKGQPESLRSQEEMIEELANEIAHEMPRYLWK